MAAAHIERIALAPIKGLGLVHPESVEVGTDGVRGDRCFHLIDAAGRMYNGKRGGHLFRVTPAYDAAADVLRLTLDDGRTVEASVELGEENETSFFGRPVPGRIVKGPFAAALSDIAGEPLRLVRPDSGGAAADRGHTVSLISRGTLERIGAQAKRPPLDGRRFRMTFEVSGIEPHAEDVWVGRHLRLGTARVRVLGNVGRCVVTTRDPDTGVSTFDTLRALAGYRGVMETTEPLPAGIWGEVLEAGAARLGDTVTAEA